MVAIGLLFALFASFVTGQPVPAGPCEPVFLPAVFVGMECGEAYAGIVWVDGQALPQVGP